MTLNLVACVMRRHFSNYGKILSYTTRKPYSLSLCSSKQQRNCIFYFQLSYCLHSSAPNYMKREKNISSSFEYKEKKVKSWALNKFHNDLKESQIIFDTQYFMELESKLKEENNHSSKFFDNSIMLALFNANDLNVAQNFLQYLLRSRGSIGVFSRVLYINILGVNNIDHQFDELIYTEYKKCVDIYGNLFDHKCLQRLCEAFASTKEWKKCLEFIEMMKLTHRVTFFNFQPLLHAALENGDLELFSKYFVSAYEISTIPSKIGGIESHVQETMQKYVQLCLENPVKVPIGHLLNILEKKFIYPKEQVADGIASCLKQAYRCSVSKTRINHRGYCKNCKKTLKPSDITEEEFEMLKEEFFKVTLAKESSFCWTTPEELECFLKFLTDHGPFDLVIDYLNMVFRNKKEFSRKEKAHNILEYFTNKGMKILLISNEKIPSRYKNAKTFAVKRPFEVSHIGQGGGIGPEALPKANTAVEANIIDQSHDDLFVLYAALHSGIDTMTMSGDYYRDSKYKLNDKCAEIFIRWQRTRQIKLVSFSKESFVAEKPKIYDPRTQENGGVLHVPFRTEHDLDLPSFDTPSSYFCVQFCQ